AFDWTAMRGRSLDGLLVRCVVRERRLGDVAFIPVRRDAQNDPAPLDPESGAGRAVADEVRRHSTPYGTVLCAVPGAVAVDGVGTG
ncbi:MAG TPA: hypothetical protein VH257_23425, partial [Chloroflexota bacterium]|nr:hypothetical protein [Chloroflexota bacterium]